MRSRSVQGLVARRFLRRGAALDALS